MEELRVKEREYEDDEARRATENKEAWEKEGDRSNSNFKDSITCWRTMCYKSGNGFILYVSMFLGAKRGGEGSWAR